MTQEEKELLMEDLCARLPYGVQVEIQGFHSGVLRGIDNGTVSTDKGINYLLRYVKPYLRPLSSMTEEERKEQLDYVCGMTFPPDPTDDRGVPFKWMQHWLDWLNSHHFDYRGLIGKGLAIAVVGEDNPYKSSTNNWNINNKNKTA